MSKSAVVYDEVNSFADNKAKLEALFGGGGGGSAVKANPPPSKPAQPSAPIVKSTPAAKMQSAPVKMVSTGDDEENMTMAQRIAKLEAIEREKKRLEALAIAQAQEESKGAPGGGGKPKRAAARCKKTDYVPPPPKGTVKLAAPPARANVKAYAVSAGGPAPWMFEFPGIESAPKPVASEADGEEDEAEEIDDGLTPE